MIIVVSGSPGSGKSTLADQLAEEFSLKVIHASGVLKELKGKKITQIDAGRAEKGTGWWESEEAQKFTHERLKNYDFDRDLDKKLMEIIEKEDNIVFDSRTLPWLSGKGFNIWLKAHEKVRAQRIAQRDNISQEEVAKLMRERFNTDKEIYRELYGFDLGENFDPFQLVLDTADFNEEEVFKIVEKKVREWFSL